MGSAELLEGCSTSTVSSKTVDRVRNALWPRTKEQDRRIEEVAEELQEVANEDIFSSAASLVVDDDFKLKIDASLVIMIMQNVLLQVSERRWLDIHTASH